MARTQKKVDLLEWVISGAQTGVDQAALAAAYDLGIRTAGWIPKGFRTLGGPRADLAKKYGLMEHPSDNYKARTYANVRDSNGTVRIAGNFSSPGELCTRNALLQFKQPSLDVHILRPPPPPQVAEWIHRNMIVVLNVAGNSEQTWPGIYQVAYDYLTEVFKRV